MPLTRTFASCALWLMPDCTLYSLDRRSQLMCSHARVVSSYTGLPLHVDDPRPADDDEENLMAPCLSTRTPQESFASDPDWDEDELVISAYPSLQQPVHTSNGYHGEVQGMASRIHMQVDERSPLLPRVTEEASEPTPPGHSQNSVPTKFTIIGQSTFYQTVSQKVVPFSQAHRI